VKKGRSAAGYNSIFLRLEKEKGETDALATPKRTIRGRKVKG